MKENKLKFKKMKNRKWLHKIQCFFFGHRWAQCPDRKTYDYFYKGEHRKGYYYFCERGCGK